MAVSAIFVVLTFPGVATGPSEDFTLYPVIADPPFSGVPQVTVSVFATVEEAVGAARVAGTVVAVMLFDAAEAGEVSELAHLRKILGIEPQ